MFKLFPNTSIAVEQILKQVSVTTELTIAEFFLEDQWPCAFFKSFYFVLFGTVQDLFTIRFLRLNYSISGSRHLCLHYGKSLHAELSLPVISSDLFSPILFNRNMMWTTHAILNFLYQYLEKETWEIKFNNILFNLPYPKFNHFNMSSIWKIIDEIKFDILLVLCLKNLAYTLHL